jgi:hypothetical protein
MKIKLKGQRFDTVGEIQMETQMLLNTLTKKHFRMHIQSDRNAGISMHSQEDDFVGDGAE